LGKRLIKPSVPGIGALLSIPRLAVRGGDA
jgi:hypothetical protein